MPAEFWYSQSYKMTFLMIRSDHTDGNLRNFINELVAFIMKIKFSSVFVLTATTSPISRERDSNSLVPEIFAYCNNFLLLKSNRAYYNQCKIRKFGYWIDDVKRRPHQELAELSASGWAARLMKSFNRMDKPAVMFCIFCTGGVDFVGGYSYFDFLKQMMQN